MAIEVNCDVAQKPCGNNYHMLKNHFMLMVAWSPGKTQGLSELCKSLPRSSLFNHFLEQNLKHGRCSVNAWVNKQCTWKMLETLGCGKEFNMHSSQFPKGRESKGLAGDSKEDRISGEMRLGKSIGQDS